VFFVVDDDGATYDNRVSYFKHAYQKEKQYLQTLTLHTPGCMPATPRTVLRSMSKTQS